MKTLMSVILALLAAPAFAHPTHIIEVAGHNHWLGLAAIAAAAAAALWQAKKGRDEEASQEDETEEDPDTEPQEA
ncbi:DUF6732 family protein [Profundibacter amoris]|uniref:Uncharacterized protein n=1 Tax=Profundibacter amoris TaxID=2171755 RepID=A0A347UKS8_9RHOB|nr:DUF6732 family protein [Profundibacter amoris]AXX99456.1 hypothetical protein BAR1_16880 [Profundibacter amoris]